MIEKFAREAPANGCHFYAYLLGEQTAFEHSTHADKFIYEVELRTGLGAHWRYAEHLAAACQEFLRQSPKPRRTLRLALRSRSRQNGQEPMANQPFVQPIMSLKVV